MGLRKAPGILFTDHMKCKEGCTWYLAESTERRAAGLWFWKEAELGLLTCEPTRTQEGNSQNKPHTHCILNTSLEFGMPVLPT